MILIYVNKRVFKFHTGVVVLHEAIMQTIDKRQEHERSLLLDLITTSTTKPQYQELVENMESQVRLTMFQLGHTFG